MMIDGIDQLTFGPTFVLINFPFRLTWFVICFKVLFHTYLISIFLGFQSADNEYGPSIAGEA